MNKKNKRTDAIDEFLETVANRYPNLPKVYQQKDYWVNVLLNAHMWREGGDRHTRAECGIEVHCNREMLIRCMNRACNAVLAGEIVGKPRLNTPHAPVIGLMRAEVDRVGAKSLEEIEAKAVELARTYNVSQQKNVCDDIHLLLKDIVEQFRAMPRKAKPELVLHAVNIVLHTAGQAANAGQQSPLDSPERRRDLIAMSVMDATSVTRVMIRRRLEEKELEPPIASRFRESRAHSNRAYLDKKLVDSDDSFGKDDEYPFGRGEDGYHR